MNELGEDKNLECYGLEGTDEILKKRIVRSLGNKKQNINDVWRQWKQRWFKRIKNIKGIINRAGTKQF